MPSGMTPLNALMRRQLTAVNQQFIHVLALQVWKDEEIVEPIRLYDLIEVRTSMAILDHMVRKGQPIQLPPDPFVPGATRGAILRAEMAMEESIDALIADAEGLDGEEAALVAEAAAPRPDYRAWLAARLAEETAPPETPGTVEPALADYCGHLIGLTEQAMAHAFVQFHAGEEAAADRAWSLSGRAMMDLTAVVHHHAQFAGRCTPGPSGFPPLEVQGPGARAEAADRALAGLTAAAAERAAAAAETPRLKRIVAKAADTYRAVVAWQPDQPFPPNRVNPPAFASFAKSREETFSGG